MRASRRCRRTGGRGSAVGGGRERAHSCSWQPGACSCVRQGFGGAAAGARSAPAGQGSGDTRCHGQGWVGVRADPLNRCRRRGRRKGGGHNRISLMLITCVLCTKRCVDECSCPVQLVGPRTSTTTGIEGHLPRRGTCPAGAFAQNHHTAPSPWLLSFVRNSPTFLTAARLVWPSLLSATQEEAQPSWPRVSVLPVVLPQDGWARPTCLRFPPASNGPLQVQKEGD